MSRLRKAMVAGFGCLLLAGCTLNAGAAYVNQQAFPPELGGLKLNQEQTDLQKQALIKRGGPTGNIQIGVYGANPQKMLMITWIDKELSKSDVEKDLQQSGQINEGKNLRASGDGYCLDITTAQKVAGTQCELGRDGRTASATLTPGTEQQAMEIATTVLTTWPKTT